jgi:dipeptidase D
LLEELDMEPKLLWNHFDEIRKIPHGSKNEARIREYILSAAQKHGFETIQDPAGNVVVKVPGSPGYEDKPVVVLQGHMDMVNEKNSDVDHDFDNDPLKLEMDGEYLTAIGTTLGADNGIGVAAAMAVAEDPDCKHPPLELLCTVDEETGLTGAFAMKGDFLEGRTLINLDTEEWGALYVGCAGGGETVINLPLGRDEMPQGNTLVRLIVSGMHGGHSGVDIHLQKANALKVLSRAIFAAYRKMELRLACIQGGNKHNAIPREARALVAVDASKKEEFQQAVSKEIEIIRNEYIKVDPELKIEFEDAEPIRVFDKSTSDAVIRLLTALPHGVFVNSYDIPDLVETSTNLAIVNCQEDNMEVTMSTRSSVDTAIDGYRNSIAALAMLAGGTVEEPEAYPGWKPDLESKVLGLAKKVYTEMYGTEPGIKAIHAGLECGIIGEKFPGIDMMSMGPQLEFPHSPDERVHIGSVAKFYEFLKSVLAAF